MEMKYKRPYFSLCLSPGAAEGSVQFLHDPRRLRSVKESSAARSADWGYSSLSPTEAWWPPPFHAYSQEKHIKVIELMNVER